MPRVLRPALAVVALLLALLVVPAAAGATAAPNLGNSQAAQACQKGGYLNFLRADGTAFANTGACADYAAQGGTFLPVAPLPDLELQVSCVTTTALTVTCTFHIINVGTVAVTGPVTLQASLTAPTGTVLTTVGASAASGPCANVSTSSSTTTNDPGYATASATCDGTITPGGDVTVVNVVVAVSGTTAVAGVPLTITAAADPANTIAESNEKNNTYSAVIATP